MVSQTASAIYREQRDRTPGGDTRACGQVVLSPPEVRGVCPHKYIPGVSVTLSLDARNTPLQTPCRRKEKIKERKQLFNH